jgi:type I restriction enzyme S subunit
LREVAEIGTGSSNRNESTSEGAYPFYVRSKEVRRIDTYEFDETAIVIPGEGGVGEIFHYVEGKYALHQRAYRIAFHDNRVVTKFAYYYLKVDFKIFIKAKAVDGTVTSIRKPMIEDFRIPVPPLEVQLEIIKILDTFSELESELEAELAARKSQYSHYRAQLLSAKEGDPEVRWVPMGDIAQNRDSLRKPVTKGIRKNGEFPYYGASGIVDYVDGYLFDGDYLLVSEDGANLLARSTPIAFSISGKNWVNNHAHVLEFETYELRRLTEIYLNSIDLSPYVAGGAQPKLSQANLNKILVPVPPVEEMKRKIAILDAFEALLSDNSMGLPSEITARRQQFEYYRNKLLTFKKLEVA